MWTKGAGSSTSRPGRSSCSTRAFLEGERLEPPKLKGLLNRQENAKNRYDAARRALLGLE